MGVMSSYWRGLSRSLPFGMIVVPFGLVFGLLATEAGLDVIEALAFSAAVIAGAAQLTALSLMQDQAPALIAIASALAVNLRVAMYSITITPHLGEAKLWQRALAAYFLVDATFAVAQAEYEAKPDMTIAQKLAFYAGSVTIVCLPWYPATVAGVLVGDALPLGSGVDFALPLCFIAIVAPMLRTLAHVAAAAVAVALSLGFVWLPYNMGLLVGGISGMMVGARVDLWLEQRRAT